MYQFMKNQKNIHFTYTPGRHIRTYHRRAEPFVVHERSVVPVDPVGVRVRVTGSNIGVVITMAIMKKYLSILLL